MPRSHIVQHHAKNPRTSRPNPREGSKGDPMQAMDGWIGSAPSEEDDRVVSGEVEMPEC